MIDVDARLAQAEAERVANQRAHEASLRRSSYGDPYYGYGRSTTATTSEATPAPFRRPAAQGTGKFTSARARKAAKAAQAAHSSKAKSGKKRQSAGNKDAQTRTSYRTSRQQRRSAATATA